MKARSVRLVGTPPAPPVLRPVDQIVAAGIYPLSPVLQARWIDAINWLRRDPSRSRWILDHNVTIRSKA